MTTFYCDRCKMRPVTGVLSVCKACVVEKKRKKHATLDAVLQSEAFHCMLNDINDTHITQMKQTIADYEKQIEALNVQHLEYKELFHALQADYNALLDSQQLAPPPLIRQTAQVFDDNYEKEVMKELADLSLPADKVHVEANAEQSAIVGKIIQNIKQIEKIKKEGRFDKARAICKAFKRKICSFLKLHYKTIALKVILTTISIALMVV